jgi:hypothetical protein
MLTCGYVCYGADMCLRLLQRMQTFGGPCPWLMCACMCTTLMALYRQVCAREKEERGPLDIVHGLVVRALGTV